MDEQVEVLLIIAAEMREMVKRVEKRISEQNGGELFRDIDGRVHLPQLERAA